MTSTSDALRLVRFIKQHGHDAWLNAEGSIGAIETYTQDGVSGQQRVVIKASLRAVREWLGY